jgi:hypothetical protein
MQCPRCKSTKLIASRHQETEYWTVGYLLKITESRECAFCGVIVQTIIPFIVVPAKQ